MLEGGEFLQLALYSHMVEAETGRAPVAVGYHLFEKFALTTREIYEFSPCPCAANSFI